MHDFRVKFFLDLDGYTIMQIFARPFVRYEDLISRFIEDEK